MKTTTKKAEATAEAEGPRERFQRLAPARTSCPPLRRKAVSDETKTKEQTRKEDHHEQCHPH